MLEGQMNPQIHGAKKIADTVALKSVKPIGGIQHQHFEFMFIVVHFEVLLDVLCLCMNAICRGQRLGIFLISTLNP